MGDLLTALLYKVGVDWVTVDGCVKFEFNDT